MKTSLFDYHLPTSLIAQQPIRPRDYSRLMIVDRKKQTISHHHFYDLPKFLTSNDVLIINQSKVIPARLFGLKSTGGKVEMLLLKKLTPNTWQALIKPGIKQNQVIKIIKKNNHNISKRITNKKSLLAKVIKINSDGHRMIKFNTKSKKRLFEAGQTPIPPYIKKLSTLTRYQTIYAKKEGSVAAPTAGFHFTKKLINELKLEKGVEIIPIILHVGLGTFTPVKTKQIENHKMHEEFFQISNKAVKQLNEAIINGKRIIAVGTTSCRVLETTKQLNHWAIESLGNFTNLFIYPPYKFKFANALVTNFHLPRSTLLMLVAAFVSWPNTKQKFVSFEKSLMGKAYQEAIKNKYRFYSFGDSMLII